MNINNLIYLISFKEDAKLKPGQVFEVVVPYLGSKNFKGDIEFPPETVEMFYKGDEQMPIHRLSFSGSRFYIFEDFYRFEGNPMRQSDIDKHYALYKHGRIRISDRAGCAYHYRKVKEEDFYDNEDAV